MSRVSLTDAQRAELQRRAHEKGVMPRTRDRLEMVRLSDAGWSIPKIAAPLSIHEQRVRHSLKAFLAQGFDALPDRPHPGQHAALTSAMEEAIRKELRQHERPWTAAQLADWVAERFGVRLTPDHLSRRLKRARIAYKRTGRSLKHKRKPEEVEQKAAQMAVHEKRGTRARSTSPTWTRRALPSRCRPPRVGIRWERGSPSRMKRRKVGG
jgi:transposase